MIAVSPMSTWWITFVFITLNNTFQKVSKYQSHPRYPIRKSAGGAGGGRCHESALDFADPGQPQLHYAIHRWWTNMMWDRDRCWKLAPVIGNVVAPNSCYLQMMLMLAELEGLLKSVKDGWNLTNGICVKIGVILQLSSFIYHFKSAQVLPERVIVGSFESFPSLLLESFSISITISLIKSLLLSILLRLWDWTVF